MAVAVLLGMVWGYAAIARKPMSPGGILGGLAVVFVFACVSRKKVRIDDVPEPMGSRLRGALDADGLGKAHLRHASGGNGGAFPRPMVNWPTVILPDRVLREWSPEAIVWSVRTDARASRDFVRRAVPSFVTGLLLLLLAVTLIERWRAKDGYIGLVFAVFVGLFVLFGVAGYRLQLAADAKLTRTDADRAAAREVLGYPYRAQRAKSRSEKWLFPAAELRGRARRLGIDLDAED